MNIEIVSTGEEVLTGAVTDSNAAYIAQMMTDSGYRVIRHHCVGDQTDVLVRQFREIDGRADAVIVTGGLGPTDDDRTREAVSETWGGRLVLNSDSEMSVLSYFQTLNREIPETNRKQMYLPEGAVCLANPVGTAPGFWVKTANTVFFFLPGVPFEMKKMLDIHVLPMLTEMVGRSAVHFRMKTLSHFGIPESETDYRLTGIETLFPGIILGLQAVFPIIHVKLYARGNDEKELERLLDEAEQWCLERTGHYVFTRTGLSMAGEAGRLLRETGKTLAVAESCTGGLIASMLTDVPGSSDYFLFSGVTYSNDAKTSVLGVDREILTAYGAVSRETVMAMARGARRVSGADIAVATSGIAGPGGGTAEKPVGTVFFGIDSEEGCEGYMFISPYEDRDKNKTLFAVKALDLLRRNLVDK